MDGGTRKQVPGPRMVRSFARSRLADALLAGVYEFLLKACNRGSVVQAGFEEPGAKEIVLDQEEPVATGGRQ